MKTIGMIGGMSWESTLEYYRLINEGVKARLGGLHSASILMHSVDFAEIERLQHEEAWDELTSEMIEIARRLEAAGAGLMMICTNTMHMMADDVQARISIPLIHIADAAAEEIKSRGVGKVGLLGTRFTMEQEFYRGRLSERHAIEVAVPDNDDMDIVHNVIYDELCLGQIRGRSKKEFLRIIDRFAVGGAGGVVLGCTEIPMLISSGDVDIPVFNTTELHAAEAVRQALA